MATSMAVGMPPAKVEKKPIKFSNLLRMSRVISFRIRKRPPLDPLILGKSQWAPA